MSSLKQDTIHGVKWTAINKFTNTFVSFIIGVILARLLSPADYGIVGMIAIFFAIAGIFIDSGFGQALIQKKDVTDADESTMFYFNVGVALVCYLILFVASPWIADFLHQPILKNIVRVAGLSMVIGAFGAVQYNMLSKSIDFKTPAIIGTSGNIISGIFGVFLAFKGFGPWTLVLQTLMGTVWNTVGVWIHSKWRPILTFSKASLKSLAAFGGNLTINSILDKIYEQGTGFLIGKFYAPSQLGYFSKGDGTANLPTSFLTGILNSVLFPVMSKIQDNDEELIHVYRRYMQITSMVIFFCCMLLIALAWPWIEFLYSSKWLPAVIFMQICTLKYMLYHVHLVNWELLLVKGRTDLCLKKEIVNKIIKFTCWIIAIPISVEAICWAGVISAVSDIFVNTYVTGKVIKYGFWKQTSDFVPYLLKGALFSLPAFAFHFTNLPPVLILLLGSLSSFVLYVLFLWKTHDENFLSLVSVIPWDKYRKKIHSNK